MKLDDLSPDLHNRIIKKLDGKRPVLLASEDLRAILQLLKTRTAVEVIGDIRPSDCAFTNLRQEESIGCCPSLTFTRSKACCV